MSGMNQHAIVPISILHCLNYFELIIIGMFIVYASCKF